MKGFNCCFLVGAEAVKELLQYLPAGAKAVKGILPFFLVGAEEMKGIVQFSLVGAEAVEGLYMDEGHLDTYTSFCMSSCNIPA